ncbi:MAG: NAD(P)-dependent oxidoreductase [Pseudomonadales bacterium]
MTNSTIGIAGTGRMGTAVAQRLIETGAPVVVWNRSPERTVEAVGAGATAIPSPGALVAACDILITSLTDFAALDAVYRGPDGLLAEGAEGKLFIELSTILPHEQITLATAAKAAGADFLECPVGGTVGPALKGQLLGLAGGTEEAWQRGEAVLQKLCKRVELLGPVGTGSQMKLAVNLPLAIYWSVLGESFSLVEGAGVGAQQFASLLADSSAGPNVLRARLDLIASALDGAKPLGTFDIDGFTKDLSLALRWAKESGAKLPVAKTVLQIYEDAQTAGLGSLDGACLARFVSATVKKN